MIAGAFRWWWRIAMLLSCFVSNLCMVLLDPNTSLWHFCCRHSTILIQEDVQRRHRHFDRLQGVKEILFPRVKTLLMLMLDTTDCKMRHLGKTKPVLPWNLPRSNNCFGFFLHDTTPGDFRKGIYQMVKDVAKLCSVLNSVHELFHKRLRICLLESFK